MNTCQPECHSRYDAARARHRRMVSLCGPDPGRVVLLTCYVQFTHGCIRHRWRDVVQVVNVRSRRGGHGDGGCRLHTAVVVWLPGSPQATARRATVQVGRVRAVDPAPLTPAEVSGVGAARPRRAVPQRCKAAAGDVRRDVRPSTEERVQTRVRSLRLLCCQEVSTGRDLTAQ